MKRYWGLCMKAANDHIGHIHAYLENLKKKYDRD